MSFNQFIIREQYEKVRGLGDRLVLMKEQIGWESFIPMVKSIFKDNSITGGRPHTDELVVVRCLLLQAWYGLSDAELEFQINDRLSFRNFLGYPENVPDFTTIWIRVFTTCARNGAETIFRACEVIAKSTGSRARCCIDLKRGSKKESKNEKTNTNKPLRASSVAHFFL